MVKSKYKTNSTEKEVIIELIAAIPNYLPYLELTKEQHLAINSYLTLSLHQGKAMKMVDFKNYSSEMANSLIEFIQSTSPPDLMDSVITIESTYGPGLADILAYVKNARALRIQAQSDVEYKNANYYVHEDKNGDIVHSLSMSEITVKIKEIPDTYESALIALVNNVPEGFMKTERLEDVANFFAYMNRYFSKYLKKNNIQEDEEERSFFE